MPCPRCVARAFTFQKIRKVQYFFRGGRACDSDFTHGNDEDDDKDPTWQIRYEFIQKLFMRTQKYHERGVTIVNAHKGILHYEPRLIDRK